MKQSSLFAALVALALSAPAFAAESAPAAEPVIETPAAEVSAAATTPAPAAVRRAPHRMTPLAIAMAGVVESEKASMATLKARLASAKDGAAMDAVNREIEQLKVDTEVQLLTLQATHHRQNGRPALADELEMAIRELRMPQRALEPASRPAPVTTPRSN